MRHPTHHDPPASFSHKIFCPSTLCHRWEWRILGNPSEMMWNFRSEEKENCENPIRGLLGSTFHMLEEANLKLPLICRTAWDDGSIRSSAYRNQGRLKFCIHVASSWNLTKLLPFRKHFFCSLVWSSFRCNFEPSKPQIAIKTVTNLFLSFYF